MREDIQVKMSDSNKKKIKSKMSDNNKKKVLDLIDRDVEQINRDVEHFEQFGNFGNADELVKQAKRIMKKDLLLLLKNDIEYGIEE